MNTTLTIQQPEIAIRTPARTNWLSRIEAFIAAYFAILFTTADDPAALRYTASKYGGEID
jgi:hypothetical protein